MSDTTWQGNGPAKILSTALLYERLKPVQPEDIAPFFLRGTMDTSEKVKSQDSQNPLNPTSKIVSGRLVIDKVNLYGYTENCSRKPCFERRTTMTYFYFTAMNRIITDNRGRIVLMKIYR